MEIGLRYLNGRGANKFRNLVLDCARISSLVLSLAFSTISGANAAELNECANSSSRECLNIAFQYLLGISPFPKNNLRGYQLVDKALNLAVASCQLNQQEGCQQVLTMFSRYPRVKDYLSQKGFRPRQFIQIVIDANSGKCTPDDPQSCYLLGSAYSDLASLTRGKSPEEYEFLVGKLQVYFEKGDNFAAKLEAVNKSCATGQLRQCKKISLEVVGRNPNPNTWGDLFDASLFGCENNIQSACRLLSDRKADVPSFLVTKQRVSRLEDLCDRQIGNACLRLANIFWDEKNTDQALKKWFKGCDAGEATSCVRFAKVNLVLYSERPSVDKLSVVFDALNRGCYRLEDDFSCHLLEHLLKG